MRRQATQVFRKVYYKKHPDPECQRSY
jgi:hypothetical protein